MASSSDAKRTDQFTKASGTGIPLLVTRTVPRERVGGRNWENGEARISLDMGVGGIVNLNMFPYGELAFTYVQGIKFY